MSSSHEASHSVTLFIGCAILGRFVSLLPNIISQIVGVFSTKLAMSPIPLVAPVIPPCTNSIILLPSLLAFGFCAGCDCSHFFRESRYSWISSCVAHCSSIFITLLFFSSRGTMFDCAGCGFCCLVGSFASLTREGFTTGELIGLGSVQALRLSTAHCIPPEKDDGSW